MKLYRKTKSRFWWVDFSVRGMRYRESTKETTRTRASIEAGKLIAKVEDQTDHLRVKKPKTLEAYAEDFVAWIEGSRLDGDTKRYYKNGWRMLKDKPIAKMRLDFIQFEHIDAMRFPGGPSNTNCALRTLRRMLGRAKQLRILRELPKINMMEEKGRTILLDEAAEIALLPHAEQPLNDVIRLMRDTGMRNQRELYCMRVENLDFVNELIKVPDSKTSAGERHIPMTERVVEILMRRCDGRTEGWVFPSVRQKKHITSGLISKMWVKARKAANLPEDLVLYCGRHDFGTYVYNATQNLKATMMVMGQTDIKTAMKYQHPGLQIVKGALKSRHTLRHTG